MSLYNVYLFSRHVLNDGRLVLGARRSLLDASGSLLRCRAANRAGVVLSRPVLLQPGNYFINVSEVQVQTEDG